MIPIEIAAGVAFALLMLVWIGLAVCLEQPPHEPNAPTGSPTDDWCRNMYQASTSLYIEIDREIWQVSTIFTSASLLILGWVVTSLAQLSLPMVVFAGSASILLVTVATLFKHRLRNFNLVHIQHLRCLEKAAAGGGPAAEYWGVHHRRKILAAKGVRWLTSIHGVMDLYAIAFLTLWIVLWLYLAYGVQPPGVYVKGPG